MKILHWDEAFHPSFGYQINSLAKYQALEGNQVTIVSSDHIDTFPVFKNFQNTNLDVDKLDDEYSKKYNIKIVRWPWHRSKLAKSRIIHNRGFLKFLRDYDADIIMVHTNDTISSIKIARHYKYIKKPLIFDNHMLDMASTNPLRNLFRLYFRIFVTPLIKKNKWIVIRTQDDDYIIKHFNIPREQAPFISFGSDLTLFYQDNNIKKEFKEKYNISQDEPIFVYAGKLTEEKGGLLLAETFQKKFNGHILNLIVVGNTNGEYGKLVDKFFEKSENNIIRFNTQRFIDLPFYYKVSDFSLFPKQCSLSFYDVQACGLPTILEDNNVNKDRLSHDNGLVFMSNSVESFREAILKNYDLYCSNFNEYLKLSRNCINFIKKEYDYKIISAQYTSLILKEFKRQNGKYN